MKRILISENIWDFDLSTALQEISEQRREQALKFKFEQGQRLCVLAYQLLQQALREEYGITDNPVFKYNESGKPSIIGHPEIFFNLSHCKEAAACVVSDHPVGIDVESLRQYKEPLAEYCMNDDEMQQIKSSENPDVEFIRLWTMKEATIKFLGTTISSGMKDLLILNKYKYTTIVRQRYIYTICE